MLRRGAMAMLIALAMAGCGGTSLLASRSLTLRQALIAADHRTLRAFVTGDTVGLCASVSPAVRAGVARTGHRPTCTAAISEVFEGVSSSGAHTMLRFIANGTRFGPATRAGDRATLIRTQDRRSARLHFELVGGHWLSSDPVLIQIRGDPQPGGSAVASLSVDF